MCEFNVQETAELSHRSPGVQARGAARLGAACPLLGCYHLFWVALPPCRHPSLGREPIRFYKPGRVRPGKWMGMPRTTKAAGGSPWETASGATCWHSRALGGRAGSAPPVDPSKADFLEGRPTAGAQSFKDSSWRETLVLMIFKQLHNQDVGLGLFLELGWANFFCETVNIWGFAGPVVSVATGPLCCHIGWERPYTTHGWMRCVPMTS